MNHVDDFVSVEDVGFRQYDVKVWTIDGDSETILRGESRLICMEAADKIKRALLTWDWSPGSGAD